MYRHANDRIVSKRAASYHKNAAGPFYVSDQCIICGLPKETAPENFAWDCTVGCTDCPTSCYIQRQPETEAQLCQIIEAMLGSEVENIRYCGSDPAVLRRLMDAGFAHLCDAL